MIAEPCIFLQVALWTQTHLLLYNHGPEGAAEKAQGIHKPSSGHFLEVNLWCFQHYSFDFNSYEKTLTS